MKNNTTEQSIASHLFYGAIPQDLHRTITTKVLSHSHTSHLSEPTHQVTPVCKHWRPQSVTGCHSHSIAPQLQPLLQRSSPELTSAHHSQSAAPHTKKKQKIQQLSVSEGKSKVPHQADERKPSPPHTQTTTTTQRPLNENNFPSRSSFWHLCAFTWILKPLVMF